VNISEAIDCLNVLQGIVYGEMTYEQKALQLAIEALKTIKELRHYPFPDGVIQLPGEEIPTVYEYNPDSISDTWD